MVCSKMDEECIKSKVYIVIQPSKAKSKKNDVKRVEILNDSQIKIFYSATLDKIYEFDHVLYEQSNKI